ncbi:MAG: hypothetical protein JJU45_03495 [Acidimicrobiia bacterium]|nr:hypothetical protein [Acidimicrobiia bacterium]
MEIRSHHWLGPHLALGVALLSMVSCATSQASQASQASQTAETSQTSGHVPLRFEGADELWYPDLDGDGEPDVMILVNQEIRLAISSNGEDYLDVVDEDGGDLVVVVGDGATVTCGAEGVVVQTFEAPGDHAATGPLRLYGLDVDGSQGVLTPNPSFFFGSDFALPELGSGCPTGG